HVWRAVIATLLATGYVAGLVAFLMDHYVTSFAVTAPRVPLIAVMLVGTLSYFLADEWLTRGTDAPRGAHAYTHACFLLSLGLAVALSFEDLFFLLIIAGIILLYFIVYGLFGAWIYRATGHPAVGAVANAVAFAWALAVVFPMLSG
ncbi:MAG: alpha/beta hydrolase, partial [Sedimenticolaceae bacterium]